MGMFDERRKKLGISSSSSPAVGESSGGASAFERRRGELVKLEEGRRQESIKKAETSKKESPKPVNKKQEAFNETVYGGTNKLRSKPKVEPVKVVPKNAITKVKEQSDNLKDMGMASTRSVMAAREEERVKDTYGMTVEELAETRAANELKNKDQFEKIARMKAREDKARDIPVVGQGLSGLDKTAEVTKPFAEVAQSLYTPGGGLSVLSAGTKSAEALVSRFLPALAGKAGSGLLPKVSRVIGGVAQKGISEALVGAPTGVGQVLANNPQASNKEILQGAEFGAGGGAVLPVAGALAKGTFKTIRGGFGGSRASVVDSTVRDVPEATQAVRGAQVANDVPVNASSLADVTQTAPLPMRNRDMVAAAQESAVPVIPSSRGQMANHANQLKNGNFSPELQQGIRNADHSYDVAHNVDSLATANENVKSLTKAEADFHGNEAGGADHIATGYRLMQELDALGEHQRALNVSKKLESDLLRSGQTSQAASIISRLSPEGQLLNLTKAATRNGKEVTVADKVKFQELAAKVQENAGAGIKANQFNAILNKLEKGENVTVAEIKQLSDYLSGAEKVVKPSKVVDDLPTEFKDVKKRDKIISFLDDAEQAALARIAARKSRLNALPLDEWADHAIVVSAQIAKGTIKAATHAEDLVKLFGEEIRPYAAQVFQKAQGLVKTVSRRAGEGDLQRAHQVLRNVTGQSAADKAIVEETANHVRKMIADAKAGRLDPADTQKLRDYSDEIADMTKDAKPGRLPTQEEKFLQSVKSLAKKIAKVESEKIPADQANREVSSLLRQVLKIADEGTPTLQRQPIDNKALSDIAHDVMEKTRPNPKPTTLQEKIVEKYLKENPKVSQKDIDSLRDLAKNITRLSGDAKIDADIAMQKILNSYEKSSVWDKTLALRYIGMLLNTHTQMINAASGPIMASYGTVVDVFGTMLDISMNKLFKTPRATTLYGTNPLKFIAGYMKNAKVGGKAGFHGVNPAGIQSTNEIRGLAFPSKYNPLGWAERTLGAVAKGADYATYKTVFDSEMVKQGYLSAKNQGIKGKADVQKHIREFVNDPPEEAILQADRIGKNTTFQRADRTGGKIANHLNNAPTLVKPGVNAIFPFVRTPVNMASNAVSNTPVGVIKGLFQLAGKDDASRREAIRTLSMGVTGSGIGAIGFYLSQIGVITGSNDSGNKDADNIREQAGKGKYRFNTSALMRYLSATVNGEGPEAAEKAAQYREGDKQFDYNKLQPLAFPLAIGAGIEGKKEQGLSSKLSGAGTDAFGSLYGMSTLKGVQNVFQPSYGGTTGEKALGTPFRIAESFFKSFSWGGLAQEARRQDPIQRKTPFNDGPIKNTKEYFKSRIPGMSQELPARKTTLGQDYKNAPGIKGSYLNPYRSEVAPYNKAAEIISGLIDRTGDLTLAPSAPLKSVSGKNIKGVHVSFNIEAKRYAKLQEDVGNAIVKRITALPKYADARLAEEIENIYTEVRKEKMNEVKKELGIVVK